MYIGPGGRLVSGTAGEEDTQFKPVTNKSNGGPNSTSATEMV